MAHIIAADDDADLRTLLKTALERLETEEIYEYTGSLGIDAPREKRMRWSWLDRESELLLVTLEDA